MKKTDEDIFNEKTLRSKFRLEFQNSNLSNIPGPLIYAASPFINVKSIDFSENSISDIPSSFYSLLPNLVTLTLVYNKISLLHNDICKLTNLNTLRLDHNNLTCLPNSIGTLKKLQVLSVSKNKLVSLPSSIGNLTESLQILNVSENCIQILPSEMGQLKSLKELYIYHNKLVSLPTTLYQLTKLEGFSFEWLRYAVPTLPTHLKGTMIAPLREQLTDLLKELSQFGMRECAFPAFVAGFSTGDFDVNRIQQDNGKTPKKHIGRSILQIAVLENDVGVVDAVLPLKPDLNYLDKENYSALGLALYEGNLCLAKKLLDAKCDVKIGSGTAGSLLHMAIELFDSEISIEIINRGAKIDSFDSNGNAPLHILFSLFDKFPIKAAMIADTIMANSGDPNIENSNGFSPVHIVADKNQIEGMRFIAHYNKRINGKLDLVPFNINLQGGKDKLSALHIATCKCNYKIVQELILAGANALSFNSDFETPRKMSRGVAVINKMLRRSEKKEIYHQLSENSLESGDICETRRGPIKSTILIFDYQSPIDSLTCKCEKLALPKEPLKTDSQTEQGGKNFMQIPKKSSSFDNLINTQLKQFTRYNALYRTLREFKGKSCVLWEAANNLHLIHSPSMRSDIIYGIGITGGAPILRALWSKIVKSSEYRGVKYELYFDKEIMLPGKKEVMNAPKTGRSPRIQKRINPQENEDLKETIITSPTKIDLEKIREFTIKSSKPFKETNFNNKSGQTTAI